MKTNRVLNTVVGAVLLGGTLAYAQQDDPQQGPLGDGPQGCPQGMPNAQMQPMPGGQGPCGNGCPMMAMPGGATGWGRGPQSGFNGGAVQRGIGPGGGMDAPRMEQRRGPESEGRGCMIPNAERVKQAGATDQQIDALQAFAFDQRIQRIDLQAAVDKADATLDHLMKSDAVDEKAALQAADALSKARGELFKQEVASRVKVREILGADVMKKLDDMRSPRALQGPGRNAPCQGWRAPGARPQGGRGPASGPAPQQGQVPPNGKDEGATPPTPDQAK